MKAAAGAGYSTATDLSDRLVRVVGMPFSEAKLIGYAYDFEQATKAIRLPKNTPALKTDKINY